MVGPCIFENVEEIGKGRAACSTHGTPCEVPRDASLFVTGFSCKDFSKLSKTFGKEERRKILSQSLGTSGRTFKGVRDHVERARPLVLILENVNVDSGDLQLLDQSLNDIGYVVGRMQFQTMDYGLPQMRTSMYLVGLLYGDLGMSADEGHSLLKDIFACAANLKIERRPLEDFLIPPGHQSLVEELQRSISAARSSSSVETQFWPAHHEESSIVHPSHPFSIYHLEINTEYDPRPHTDLNASPSST